MLRGGTIEKSWKHAASPPPPSPPPSFALTAFKFWISDGEGGMQSACFLGHPLVAYYIIQICPEKNTGLNFKGDEEVGEQPRRPLVLTFAPLPAPPLKPLRFSCGSALHDLHMSCISRICIARFRFALDLSALAVIRR